MQRNPNTYDMVFLADDEWGNDTMEEVAKEWFQDYPDCQFVEVYEHGGWWLVFRRDLSICGTANDMAVLPKPLPRPQEFSGISIRRQPKIIPLMVEQSRKQTVTRKELAIA